MKTIPYWDQAALIPLREGILGVGPGKADFVAPGIITALPESPNEPWPPELSPWDTIIIGGIRAPGLARVSGGRGRRLPTMIIPGASGSSTDFLGEDPVAFTIQLTLWTPKQWAWLQDFIKPLLPPPTALIHPVAVKVYYPGLALLNVYDIYINRIAIPQPDAYQRGHIEISCSEFMPFLNTGASPLLPGTEIRTNPDGTTTITSKPPPPTPLLNSLGPNP